MPSQTILTCYRREYLLFWTIISTNQGIFCWKCQNSCKNNPLSIYIHYTCDEQVLRESAGAFFRTTNSLVSARRSHSSGVRDLVVRCLLFNPGVSCSNPCVCASFLQVFRRFSLFRNYETPPLFGFVILFSRKFYNVPKWDPSFF